MERPYQGPSATTRSTRSLSLATRVLVHSWPVAARSCSLASPLLVLVVTTSAGLGACGRFDFESVAARADGPAAGDASSGYRAIVLADQPAAYWRFEEPSGTTALDEIGNAHPGTFGGVIARVPGVLADGSTGALFDGTTTRLTIGDAFGFGGTSPYSIEMWVEPSQVDSSVRFLVDRRSTVTPQDGYTIYFASSFTLTSRTIANVEQAYASGSGLALGTYTHVVATFDGRSTALYLDAAAIDGTADTTPIQNTAGTLVFGDVPTGQTAKLAGVLDEVAIYDHALTAAQVAAHYHAVRP